MFQDHKGECVGFESTGTVEKSSEDSSTQTKEISTTETEAQASSSKEAGMQTEAVLAGVAAKLEADAEARLAKFLQRIEPLVLKELDRVAKSREQLKAIEVTNGEDQSEPASCVHTLHASAQALIKGLQQVNCLSWSPTGAVIAVGHGWATHEAWCSHDSEIHLYNINLQEFDPEKPSKILASPSCVTTLRYHPSVPSLLAAGTYSGEVMVWGGSESSPVRAGPSEGHGEAVTAVVWMATASSDQQPQALLSAGLDGRLLAWRLESTTGPLTQQHSFEIGRQHLPERLRSSSCDDLQPITSMSLVGRGNQPHCLVGTQAGCVLLCDLRDPTKEDPVVLSFQGHQGAVTSLSMHPTKPQLFASCGEDREIHIHDLRQESVLRVLQCSRSCVGASWGAGGCLVWWGGGSEAEILVVRDDLSSSQLATLEPGTGLGNPGHATALLFNATLPRLVAVGDADARVRIWKIPLPSATR